MMINTIMSMGRYVEYYDNITGHTMKNASVWEEGRGWEIYDNCTHQEECFRVWGGGGGGGGGRFMITGHIRKNALGCGEGRWWKLYDNWTHHEECFGVWGGGGGEVVGDL